MGRGACARELIRWPLLPDVCRCCFSRIALVDVTGRGLTVACRDLFISCVLSFGV